MEVATMQAAKLAVTKSGEDAEVDHSSLALIFDRIQERARPPRATVDASSSAGAVGRRVWRAGLCGRFPSSTIQS